MKRFKIWIEGDNCLVDVEGKVAKLGFVTTRIIRSSDQAEASKIVLDALTKELGAIVTNNKLNPPNVYIKEISEVTWFKDYFVFHKGFTWYPEDAEEN